MKIRKFITTNTINNPQKKKKRATFRRLRAMIKECRELSDDGAYDDSLLLPLPDDHSTPLAIAASPLRGPLLLDKVSVDVS